VKNLKKEKSTMKKSIIFSVIAIFAILAVACQPQVVTETVVQTQIVEKVVEKVVEVEKKSTCEKPLNIAIIGAFRNDFRLSFFNAALMTDPEAVLERQGPNARSPDMIRFTSNDDVARLEPVIRSYLREASGYAEADVKPARVTASYDLPEELSEALDADPALAEAFHVLTPGRQNSYVLNLNAAKQTETRLRRIAGFRHKILAGKGATER
jgi:uncharacterized protein YdeI (YjbR/CyaY-like superfamily)